MRWTMCAMLLAVAIAGFGSPGAGVAFQPGQPIATTANVVHLVPALTAAAPLATASRSDTRACFDNECEIAVSGRVTIPLNGRSGFNAVNVEVIDPTWVRFTVNHSHGYLESTVGPGGTATLRNGSAGLVFRVKAVRGGTAMFKMSPV